MLEINVEHVGAQKTASVSGEVTVSSAPALLERLKEIMPGTEALRVRLAEVPYMDSSGVAVLVQVYRLSKDAGVDLVLLDPSPEVSAVIELSRLNELFSIEKTTA